MKKIENENDAKKSLHGIPRNGIRRIGIRWNRIGQKGKTPDYFTSQIHLIH